VRAFFVCAHALVHIGGQKSHKAITEMLRRGDSQYYHTASNNTSVRACVRTVGQVAPSHGGCAGEGGTARYAVCGHSAFWAATSGCKG